MNSEKNKKFDSKDFYKQSFDAESSLLKSIRMSLVTGKEFLVPKQLNFEFDPKVSQVYITLFQPGLKKIRWGARRKDLKATIQRVIEKLQGNRRFQDFNIEDTKSCRILFEMVIEENDCNIRNLTIHKFSKNRFEAGITGFKYIYNDIPRFFMPTDSITHSILTVNQLLNFLSKQTGHAKRTNSIKERAHLMRHEPIKYKLIKSVAFITYEDNILPLHRGYPMPVQFDPQILYESTLKSMDWLIENMNDDGSFLYFYDGVKDTKVDLDHPKMTDPLYNNILRHSGGTITLFRGYEISGHEKYLKAARKSIDFLISTFREHKYKERYACFPFFNKKSKLGGAGIGLVALMHYYLHTGDERYRDYMDGLVRHLLSRIASDGEMIGYYIHPRFNKGKPLTMEIIESMPLEIKKQLFSFYYPGEALLGLALYYLHTKNIEHDLKTEIKEKSIRALDFLVDIRPKRYKELFLALPADAWLMQAIEEWVKVDGVKKQSYIDFVFSDAEQMFEHMYKEDNSPWFDYVGGFFYDYGDSVYHDGSRCEGVIAAYHLAKHLGQEQRAEKIMEYMILSAKGLLYTRHTPESMYAHKIPENSLNSFRFKLTRAWVRVDSVQHTACFFSRLYPLLDDVSFQSTDEQKHRLNDQSGINQLAIEKRIGKGGFAEVFLSRDENNNSLALKKVYHPRYINRLEQEVKALQVMNRYHDPLLFHYAQKQGEDFYFVFDYADGGNLKRHIDKNGPFNLEQCEIFIKELLTILEYAYKNNLLHLDIKPANILIHNNRYWLADWGLSQFGSRIKTIHLKGNPIYLAPEMYYGERSFASEIYAVGCSLYYLVTGKAVFNLKNDHHDFIKIYSHVYLYPELDKAIPKRIKYLLVRMLDKNPENRASLNEIKDILADRNFILPEVVSWKDSNPPAITNPLEMLGKLAENDVPYAQDRLGRVYKNGRDGVKVNIEKAYQYFKLAAESGLASAQCNYGLLFYAGDFVEKNDDTAFFWIEKAARQGHDKAQYYLAKLYESGRGVDKDIEQSTYWYRMSAKNAYKRAYKKLAEMNCKVEVSL